MLQSQRKLTATVRDGLQCSIIFQRPIAAIYSLEVGILLYNQLASSVCIPDLGHNASKEY